MEGKGRKGRKLKEKGGNKEEGCFRLIAFEGMKKERRGNQKSFLPYEKRGGRTY